MEDMQELIADGVCIMLQAVSTIKIRKPGSCGDGITRLDGASKDSQDGEALWNLKGSVIPHEFSETGVPKNSKRLYFCYLDNGNGVISCQKKKKKLCKQLNILM